MKDIYKCRGKKFCYVKGRLQPTSSLGDFYLKSAIYDLDKKNLYNDNYINDKIKKYEGPFIINVPDIKIFNLTKKDNFLIIGSDGLWDYLNSKEIIKLSKQFLDENNNNFIENKINEDSEKLAFGLMQRIIEKSAKKHRIDAIDILDMNLGKKLRRSHDDITIIIFDLSKMEEN